MNSIPVKSVWNGIGLSAAPTIVVRSLGTPDRSQPTPFSARNTTRSAIARTPIPLIVSITATAFSPPRIVYIAAITAIGAANHQSGQSTPSIDFRNSEPE